MLRDNRSFLRKLNSLSRAMVLFERYYLKYYSFLMTNHNNYLFAAAIQRCVWLQLYGYGTVVSNFKTTI